MTPSGPRRRRLGLLPLLCLGACTALDRSVEVEWRTTGTEPAWVAIESGVGHVYVPGTVNGHSTTMLVDSGAEITTIDRGFALRMGLEEFGSARIAGASGRTSGTFVRLDSVTVGDLTMRGVAAVAIDLSGISWSVDREMPMLLGRELFENAVVELDYPGSRIRLHPAGGFEYRGTGRTQPMYGSDLRTVDCQVGDLPPARFRIDTGSEQALMVFEDYATEHSLPDADAALSTTLGSAIGGYSLETTALLPSFTFSGFELRDVPASFPTPESGAFTNAADAGNLGGGLFRRFHVWIDFTRNRMHVEPGPYFRG